MVKKLAFVNGKGGVAKTTSIFHISGVLAKKKEKVLIVDGDKQRNATKIFLMNNEEEVKKGTLFDFLHGTPIEDCVSQTFFQTRGNAKAKYCGVDIISSDIRLADESLLMDVDTIKVKDKFDNFLEENGYTWVLVDMPPSNLALDKIVFSSMVTDIVCPFSSDLFSQDGYVDIMNEVDEGRKYNPNLNILGVFLSRYMTNCGVDSYVRESLIDNIASFIDIQIPLMSDVREAVMFGRPISYYKTVSKSKSAYEKLVNEITRRLK